MTDATREGRTILNLEELVKGMLAPAPITGEDLDATAGGEYPLVPIVAPAEDAVEQERRLRG